jgi:hypothetical protein
MRLAPAAGISIQHTCSRRGDHGSSSSPTPHSPHARASAATHWAARRSRARRTNQRGPGDVHGSPVPSPPPEPDWDWEGCLSMSPICDRFVFLDTPTCLVSNIFSISFRFSRRSITIKKWRNYCLTGRTCLCARVAFFGA